MAGKAGLKAGLIGAVVVALLTALSILLGGALPILGRVFGGLVLLAYAGVGALAGSFLAVPRTAGRGARAGAIAGLIGGAGGGVVWVVAAAIRTALAVWGDIIPFIDLQRIQQPTGPGGGMETLAVMIGGLCLTSLVAGIGAGAVGGAIFGAAKRD
jgi:hypothetical protein